MKKIPNRQEWGAVRLALWVAVVGAVASGSGCRLVRCARDAYELALRDRGALLQLASYRLPPDSATRSIRFTRETLRTHGLYLRAVNSEDYLYIDAQGRLYRNGELIRTVRDDGELLIAADAARLYTDGVPLPVDVLGWDVFWVADDESPPSVRQSVSPRVVLVDSFMRTHLTNNYCRVTAGSWTLRQHGGGMPTDEAEYTSSSFQRAVNPFSILGDNHGWLTYGTDEWMNYHSEISFYFGVPRTNNWSDAATVPDDTDMLIVQGSMNRPQVAFGWVGKERTFALMTRRTNEAWRVVGRWEGKRPPLTDWVRLGLRVRAGDDVEALLDHVAVFRTNLAMRISGPFHIVAGGEPVEADSVRAYSLPAEPDPGGSVYLRSKFFAAKKELKGRDPVEFGEWSKSTTAFVASRETGTNGMHKARIKTRFPLMGDFSYESVPFSDVAGVIPRGRYEFTFESGENRVDVGASGATPVFVLETELSEHGWQAKNLPPEVWPPDAYEFTLRFSREECHGNRIAVWRNGKARCVTARVDGPLTVSVARVGAGEPSFPNPQHHWLRCANLSNELFEEAPAEWSWIEGAFRMDCRWACQNQWNFMACGSPGVPFMVSKKTYHGDQVHECFMSLRPAWPCDAWDRDFRYDREKDSGLKIFQAHGGWYVRRDLNVSFCMDGRNPLSGYSVLFGADDNRETRLMRKGRIVATTQSDRFLFKGSAGPSQVHWMWWKFTIYRNGGRIRCFMNDALMFDYTDIDPLPGGHLGFWSVRNGFTLARVVSTAERVGLDPQVMYVPNDVPGAWEPMQRDSVALSAGHGPGMTRVIANVGAGFFAVRRVLPRPVDLTETPVLHLPLSLAFQAAVNVHLDISGKVYVIPLTAPLSGMKGLLGPEFEHGECFRVPTLDESELLETRYLGDAHMRNSALSINLLKALKPTGGEGKPPELRSITVGNSSNLAYLLAGADGRNTAGTWYEVGLPTFSKD